MKHIKMFVFGLFFIIIDLQFPFFEISYNYNHEFGEGVKTFALVEVAKIITSDSYRINITSDLIGYLLIFISLAGLVKYHKRFEMARYASIVGALTYVLFKVAPFVLHDDTLVVALYIIYAINILAISVILFSVAIGVSKQVDPYLHMEVGKDLKFAWELNLISAIAYPFMQILVVITFMFAQFGYVIIKAANILSIVYFCYILIKHVKQINIFEEDRKALNTNE